MKQAAHGLVTLALAAALAALLLAFAAPPSLGAPQATQPIVVDHTCTDVAQIPDYWLDRAKGRLFHYAHTSHGSQIVSGLAALYQEDNRYDYDLLSASSGQPPTVLPLICGAGRVCIYDGQPGYDGQPYEDYITPELYWASPDGLTRTRIVADTGLYADSMWSWCGQQSYNPVGTVQEYLDTLAGLQAAYPSMRFILMTGHSDGGSPTLARNNGLVRQFAAAHNMVLYDFEDIESYDPDGNYYANDGEGYCEWCDAWCAAHPEDCQILPDSCAHSHPLACKLKAQAFWWMMARLAGWPGPEDPPGLASSTKQASRTSLHSGETLTYTLRLVSAAGPLAATVSVTDTLPPGLSYVPGSLAATSGTPDDANAPELRWSGSLSPTPVVTITYAATVSAAGPQRITNTARIRVPGYPVIERSVAILVDPHTVYLPIVWRR